LIDEGAQEGRFNPASHVEAMAMATEDKKPGQKPPAMVKDTPRLTRDIVAGRRAGTYQTR
jgi:hypothetical protein